jgi:dipeptidase E
MRLFLCSYRAGSHTKALVDFFGAGARVGLISNALDYKTKQDRAAKLAEIYEFYEALGLKFEEIDLRKYFTSQVNADVLRGYKNIWIAGGNVFLLRRALKYTGLDKILATAVKSGEIAAGGESAGAMIWGPTLKYSEMNGDEDSASFITEGYRPEIIWDGLGLINYVPVPHYRSFGYEPEINKYIERLNSAGTKHKEMTDEQAIVIDNDKEKLLK